MRTKITIELLNLPLRALFKFILILWRKKDRQNKERKKERKKERERERKDFDDRWWKAMDWCAAVFTKIFLPLLIILKNGQLEKGFQKSSQKMQSWIVLKTKILIYIQNNQSLMHENIFLFTKISNSRLFFKFYNSFYKSFRLYF